MYIPRHFAEDDPQTIRDFIRRHDFATIVTAAGGGILASHAPLLLDEADGPPGALIGHLARGNPQVAALRGGARVLALFQGPHAYIPVGWYERRTTVPTWSYAAVYVEGTARVIEDRAAILDLLDRTARAHEPDGGWRLDPEASWIAPLLAGIEAFSIRVESIRGKFKLDQNMSPEDRAGVIRGLRASGDTGQAELAAMIQETLRPR
ncbi:MAG TPA: FMN-binding negative transcriptional regulator [Candidatus Polarisedimenticolia bacterium]|nr:FMN-binding negative transcriptional regulator [Candidatus Polarisedimenticolia bacterium]